MPAWTYDFTIMPDDPFPVANITQYDGLEIEVLDGALRCTVDWYWSRYRPDLPGPVTDNEILVAAEVVWLSISGGIWLNFAHTVAGNTYRGFYIGADGSYIGHYHSGGQGPSGTGGSWTALNTPHLFVIEYNKTTGAVRLLHNGIEVVSGSYGSGMTGDLWSIHQEGNDDVAINKLYFGPLSAGVPSSGPTPEAKQEGTRFRNDDGSETAATWASAQDGNLTAPLGGNIRFRAIIDSVADVVSAVYTLFYKKSTDSVYSAVPVGPSSPIPTWVANGALSINAAGITPAHPAGIQLNDILVLFVETANQAVSIVGGGGTWAPVGTPVGTGTAGSTSATRLSMFWSRYDGSQSPPTTSDSGDHQLGLIAAFRGCKKTGDPFTSVSTFVAEAGPSSFTIPGLTTTEDNCLVVLVAADDYDNASTSRYSSWTNASLGSLTERYDGGSTTQNGGGLGIATGTKATAGVVSTTTVAANASILANVNASFSLSPEERPVYISPSSNITGGGEATTAQLTPPTGKSTSDFTVGRMWDDENGTDAIDLASDGYTELEWSLRAQSPAANGDIYQFRVYSGLVPLTSYDVTPEWTIGSPSSPSTAYWGILALIS